jgi:hypothetical protein
MKRMWWIILLVAVGVGLAILIGVLGTRNQPPSQSESVSSLCSSLTSLESSTKSLTSLDPQTASKSDYQSAVSTVQSDWNQVASDAKDVASASMSQLDSAWGDFSAAVKGVQSDASASDALNSISQSAQALQTTTQSTISGLSCS